MALGAGCAGAPESPREAYATPEIAAPARAAPTFRVLDDFDWTQTLAARATGPAAAALERERLGLFPAGRFRLATGACATCGVPEAAGWWFRDAVIGVPEPRPETGEPAPPPVVWLKAPHVVTGATLSRDARALEAGGMRWPLALTPPLPTNTAYVDAATAAYFAGRTLRARGVAQTSASGTTFVARTLWPDDARLDVASAALDPLRGRETLGTLIEAQTSAAAAGIDTRVLFERAADAPRDWAGRPVLAFVLSGAQSSSDGSRAGHLAAATGVLGAGGEWSDWLVTDFYPLAEPTAKDILPGAVPMDNYLLGLNSGQLYYRPAYMLVAVLRAPRAAAAVQAALDDTMSRYYCRDFEFDRERLNSTTMTIAPLRDIGWRIPQTGPTSRAAGVFAAPLAVLAGRSFAAGRDAYQVLAAEKTRLLPRVAFEVAGHDLLALAAGGAATAGDAETAGAALTPFERMLADDVDAVVFVRLPQVPSARPLGTYPVRSLLEYGAWLLASPAPFETAPRPPARAFPEEVARACERTAAARGARAVR